MEPFDKNLIKKYLLGECNREESQRVEAWTELSQENREEFLSLKKTLESVDKLAHIFHEIRIEDELQKSLRKLEGPEYSKTVAVAGSRFTLRNLLRVAAFVVAVFSLSFFLSYLILSSKNNQQTQKSFINEVVAPKGGMSMVILPDGSHVWLNGGTRLRYDESFGRTARNVELEGEAYFKVKKDPKKPFVVNTSELKIKALGTSFNVKAYPDEKIISTTLEEGLVKIEGPNVDVSIKPNQNFTYVRQHITKSPISPAVVDPDLKKQENHKVEVQGKTLSNVNTQLYTAWKDDKWIIESEDLSGIIPILERKFNVSIRVESGKLLHYKFRGTFEHETLEQILNAICLSAPLKYSLDKGQVMITSDRKRKANYTNITKENKTNSD